MAVFIIATGSGFPIFRWRISKRGLVREPIWAARTLSRGMGLRPFDAEREPLAVTDAPS